MNIPSSLARRKENENQFSCARKNGLHFLIVFVDLNALFFPGCAMAMGVREAKRRHILSKGLYTLLIFLFKNNTFCFHSAGALCGLLRLD